MADAPVDQCFTDDRYNTPVRTALENLKNVFLHNHSQVKGKDGNSGISNNLTILTLIIIFSLGGAPAPEIFNPPHWLATLFGTPPVPTNNKNAGHPTYPDMIDVINWKVTGDSAKRDWTIAWTFFCRAKIVPKKPDNTATYRDQCTRLLPGAIVFKKVEINNDPVKWLHNR
jgi:hypothetical protein